LASLDRLVVWSTDAPFRCRAPSQIHAQQWNVYDIDIGLKQCSTLLARAATCVVSQRHFLVSKNLADGLFQEGQRLWQCHRFSDTA
jgi:hypothetical protein